MIGVVYGVDLKNAGGRRGGVFLLSFSCISLAQYFGYWRGVLRSAFFLSIPLYYTHSLVAIRGFGSGK